MSNPSNSETVAGPSGSYANEDPAWLPPGATYVDGGVEFKMKMNFNVDVNKERGEMRKANKEQKRLKEKYHMLEDTPIYVLEEIERLQDEFGKKPEDPNLQEKKSLIIFHSCRSGCISRG
jgi:hypothetical protein